jgi:hypothetical protein
MTASMIVDSAEDLSEPLPAGITGMLSVLNTGEGDIEVTFSDENEVDVERALKMLKDMQKRGYAIMVKHDDGTYARAESIDEQTRCYVIREADPETTAATGKRATKKKRVPIRKARAVGIGRTAGG